ncbi:MAG: phospho-N-acetylmuramoyl-pentapeptide-transferase, partial [Oscillospiraceae bacterium]
MRIWMLAVIAAVSFAVSALLGRVLIPFLHKLHFGQTILDIGPNWHKKKEGTPTMGGLMFIGAMAAGITVTVFLGIAFGGTDMNGDIGLLRMKELIAGTVMAMAFGFVGFIDDYIKVVKKRNLGLSAWGKIILQVIIIAAYFATMRILGNTGTGIPFPFIGTLELGWFYYPLMAVAIIYIVNAVNLLDGVDGLCGSVTVVYAIAFMFIAGTAGYFWQEAYSAALAGALIGFLIYNLPPAKTFM